MIKGFLIGLCLLLILAALACTPAETIKVKATAAKAGQLFCEFQGPGGPVIVGLTNAAVAALAPEIEPIAIIATGATKDYVDAACAKVAGKPVPPPEGGVPQIAIEPPAPGGQ